MEDSIVKTARVPRLLGADDYDDIEEIRARYEPAPRDFLRVLAVSDVPVKTPVLVCTRCDKWCKHEPAGTEVVLVGDSATGVRDIYACTACGLRRVWGMRSMTSARGIRWN